MPEKSRDIPLAEITLRKYEKPYALEERELVRKVCLSVGLLQYGDSRDIIVDIFYMLLKNGSLDAIELEEKVKACRIEHNLPLLGVASSNVRRQLRRLKESFLIEKFDGKYRVAENAPLVEIFEQQIERYLLPTMLLRIKEHLAEIEKLRPQKIPQGQQELKGPTPLEVPQVPEQKEIPATVKRIILPQ